MYKLYIPFSLLLVFSQAQTADAQGSAKRKIKEKAPISEKQLAIKRANYTSGSPTAMQRRNAALTRKATREYKFSRLRESEPLTPWEAKQDQRARKIVNKDSLQNETRRAKNQEANNTYNTAQKANRANNNKIRRRENVAAGRHRNQDYSTKVQWAIKVLDAMSASKIPRNTRILETNYHNDKSSIFTRLLRGQEVTLMAPGVFTTMVTEGNPGAVDDTRASNLKIVFTPKDGQVRVTVYEKTPGLPGVHSFKKTDVFYAEASSLGNGTYSSETNSIYTAANLKTNPKGLPNPGVRLTIKNTDRNLALAKKYKKVKSWFGTGDKEVTKMDGEMTISFDKHGRAMLRSKINRTNGTHVSHDTQTIGKANAAVILVPKATIPSFAAREGDVVEP